jgi:hypothetical protein
MNLCVDSNSFAPGETVFIDMPQASYDGMATQVVSPRPWDLVEPEQVLVKNPLDPNWVLKMHQSFLVKAADRGYPDRYEPARVNTAPVPAGTVIW